MRRDAGEEGGREFSSKMPRTMSNLPDFPRRPFLYVHLLYSKSMVQPNLSPNTDVTNQLAQMVASCLLNLKDMGSSPDKSPFV